MDKYVIRGLKKALSLATIKLNLGEEYGTKIIGFNNRPLQLVKLLSGRNVLTLEEGRKHVDFLRKSLDLTNPESTAKTFIQLMEIIEGAKREFEPTQKPYVGYIGDDMVRSFEGQQANILLFSNSMTKGLNFYVGWEIPEGSIPLGRTQSSAVFFLQMAFRSDYFSDQGKLKNTASTLGRRNVLADALHFSLGTFGASLREDFKNQTEK